MQVIKKIGPAYIPLPPLRILRREPTDIRKVVISEDKLNEMMRSNTTNAFFILNETTIDVAWLIDDTLCKHCFCLPKDNAEFFEGSFTLKLDEKLERFLGDGTKSKNVRRFVDKAMAWEVQGEAIGSFEWSVLRASLAGKVLCVS